MPQIIPETLKPYTFHGVTLDWVGKKNATGLCPFCDHEFAVEVETSKFNCFRCGASGNGISFLRKLWEESKSHTNEYSNLCHDRGFAFDKTLKTWEAAKSLASGDWIIPGRDENGDICQLYRYRLVGDKRKLLGTPGFKHGMFGRHLYDPGCDLVYLCEGPWDCMKFWEVMTSLREGENGFEVTQNSRMSLLAGACVLGVPGCNVFKKEWAKLFAGKGLVILFDNDHPVRNPKTDKITAPASLQGVRRIARILAEAGVQPRGIQWIRWGQEWYNPSLPSGSDIRDLLLRRLNLAAPTEV